MGLDIYVYKPIKKNDFLVNEGDFSILDKNSPLLIFKDFLFNKNIEYLDLKKTFKKAGLNINDYKWCMQTGTEKSVNAEDKYSLVGEGTMERCGKDNITVVIGKEEDSLYDGEICNGYFEFEHEKTGKRVIVINPLTFRKRNICMCREEVGYQRKGANKKFYSDNMWNSDYVIDLKTLKSHWKKYFSGEIKEEKKIGMCDEPYGYGLEFDNTAEECKKRFKENIIKNFKEGETFVCYC